MQFQSDALAVGWRHQQSSRVKRTGCWGLSLDHDRQEVVISGASQQWAAAQVKHTEIFEGQNAVSLLLRYQRQVCGVLWRFLQGNRRNRIEKKLLCCTLLKIEGSVLQKKIQLNGFHWFFFFEEPSNLKVLKGVGSQAWPWITPSLPHPAYFSVFLL